VASHIVECEYMFSNTLDARSYFNNCVPRFDLPIIILFRHQVGSAEE
jgi:hypothetical protein